MPSGNLERLKAGLKQGLATAWRTWLWIMKILVPISLGVALLKWTGLLPWLGVVLGPVMVWLNLPAEAALPLILGMATGPAATVGAMAMLNFTPAQMTLIGLYCLTAHSLPQEAIIQGQSGFSAWKSALVRILAGAALCVIVGPLIGATPELPQAAGAAASQALGFKEVLLEWLFEVYHLGLTMLVLVFAFLTALEIFRAMNWIQPIVRLLSPFLRAMGLSPNVGLLWVAANMFGLAYGSAIIVEESNSGRLSEEEVQGLHWSIAINHGLFDDPALFLSLGLPALWLYLPRLLMAIAVVRIWTLYRLIKRRVSPKPV